MCIRKRHARPLSRGRLGRDRVTIRRQMQIGAQVLITDSKHEMWLIGINPSMNSQNPRRDMLDALGNADELPNSSVIGGRGAR